MVDENSWLTETLESIEAPHWDSMYMWQEKEDMGPYDCYLSLEEWRNVLTPLLRSSGDEDSRILITVRL